MTEQQRPDEDVEGHARKPAEEEGSVDDVAGQRLRLDKEMSGDDVEGHKHMLEEDSADDVAGHMPRRPQ
jgi:hypothetical protein